MAAKKLEEILLCCEILLKRGPADVSNPQITGVVFDSRKVSPGMIFVAIPGTLTNGHFYLDQAVESGASAIVYDDPAYDKNYTVPSVRVRNAAIALGKLASAFYDHPSSELKLIGVTGTNGKTTTVTLLHRLFNKLGYLSGCFSTICNYIGNEPREATHTTPDPVQLNHTMREMVDAGCRYAFMEVSSHALVQNRISGLTFTGGIFTNITHDHLDYHKSFNDYLQAKKSFFDLLMEHSFAIINADDRNGRIMVQNTKAKVEFYGLKSLVKFKARIIESHMDGMLLEIDQTQVWSKIIGAFNAYNLLAVYSCSRLLGIGKEEALQGLSTLETVKGRFQYMRSNQGITAIIDYAHTPDALQNVLKTIHQVRKGDVKVITVVGAGGDRDRMKRPKMSRIASELSNLVILTSDNPRNEDPEQIIKDMQNGLDARHQKKIITITNRREAIKTACMLARPDDIILIAGKGHEDYQEIKGTKYHFSDSEIVEEIFKTNKIL
ncbi:MAG: UDP-N-acetylmuramoyl-L-alanyl-D-glutamate--2,6-diaminopimelate ligase [Bacteroidales bacterium]|nr:UDP-N-acetylmuramoyl-L-alanyl-D-glutamate--2,6-diaminopimelate ligase [Bacteroidales bacterium]